MKLGALSRYAAAIGIGEDALEAAQDDDAPQVAGLALVLAQLEPLVADGLQHRELAAVARGLPCAQPAPATCSRGSSPTANSGNSRRAVRT